MQSHVLAIYFVHYFIQFPTDFFHCWNFWKNVSVFPVFFHCLIFLFYCRDMFLLVVLCISLSSFPTFAQKEGMCFTYPIVLMARHKCVNIHTIPYRWLRFLLTDSDLNKVNHIQVKRWFTFLTNIWYESSRPRKIWFMCTYRLDFSSSSSIFPLFLGSYVSVYRIIVLKIQQIFQSK